MPRGPTCEGRGRAERRSKRAPRFELRRKAGPILRTALIVAFLFATSRSFAGKGTIAVGGGRIAYWFYAPEWIWQRQNINIIIVFENGLATTATVTARLHFPPYHDDRFSYDGPTTQKLVLGGHERGRIAFANILALDEKVQPDGERIRFRPGSFVFTVEFEARADGHSATARHFYAVRTVRGAIVRQGPWAMWLPVLLILGWCAIIFLVVPRMGLPGAWKIPTQIEDLPRTHGSNQAGSRNA